jgi:uncharacterized protein YqfB (UPF0267 family)
MKIFLSWSKHPSKEVVLALHRWLPSVIQLLDPWMSDQDIQSSERWSNSIGSQFEENNFGIIILTHNNQREPWINFEAGALSKVIDKSRVVPYLFGLQIADLLSGPLSQFHGRESNRDGTWQLIRDINASLANPLDQNRLERAFGLNWPELESRLTEILDATTNEFTPKRTDGDKINEILGFIRDSNSSAEILQDILKETKQAKIMIRESGIMSSSHLPKIILSSVRMQMQAFLKPGRFEVNDDEKTVTITFDTRGKFHYRQANQKRDELEKIVKEVAGPFWRLYVVGPELNEELPDFGPSPQP